MLHKKFILNLSTYFLNKKLIEVFLYVLNQFKINEKMGSSHQAFYPNAPFFQDRGYKTLLLIFYNEKVPFIDFLSKSK